MSKTGHGTIEITVGNTSFTLKPTLRAFRAIETKFGGVVPAMSAVGAASVSAVAFVIAAGSGADTNKRKELEAIEEALFDAGVNSFGSGAISFLSALLNPAGKTDAELEAEKAAANSGNE